MKCDVLVVGSGGREHAIAWKLSASPRVGRIFCAPGNAGTAAIATNVPIPALDIPALVEFARREGIGLTVAGPDDALAAGIADEFLAAGLPLFGPSRAAARLESSKAFAKEFMRRHGIPTAGSAEFSDPEAALAHVRSAPLPMVVKADGLALGKGVVIATTVAEAEAAVRAAMVENAFGEAGRTILVEEFLTGRECSIHAIVDGSGYVAFPDARDHKRALDGDRGPNTGGMGTVSPSGVLDAQMWERVHTEILGRFVAGIRADGLAYRGMLFPGLMITADGPKVLEFNCRFGDPETQVLLRRMESDLFELLAACTEDRVSSVVPRWSPDAAACVIMASGGYPGKSTPGKAITGLEAAASRESVEIFHAGTKLDNGTPVTAGGRVLGVTATAPALEDARARAYAAVGGIHFGGCQFRTDIGA